MAKLKETDLSNPVSNYFQSVFPECEIFYEVKSYGSRKIDIVIRTKEGLIISVELKLSLNLQVIHQAHTNTDFSHFTFIAIPKKSVMRIKKDFIVSICKALNIGVIVVGNSYQDFKTESYFHETTEKTPKKKLKLLEGQKTFSQGGESGGACYTEFKQTCENIVKFLDTCANKSCSFDYLIDNIQHHYKNKPSAKSSLKKYIADGIVKGVKISDGEIKLIV